MAFLETLVLVLQPTVIVLAVLEQVAQQILLVSPFLELGWIHLPTQPSISKRVDMFGWISMQPAILSHGY